MALLSMNIGAGESVADRAPPLDGVPQPQQTPPRRTAHRHRLCHSTPSCIPSWSVRQRGPRTTAGIRRQGRSGDTLCWQTAR